jgi:hypothetical protein
LTDKAPTRTIIAIILIGTPSPALSLKILNKKASPVPLRFNEKYGRRDVSLYDIPSIEIS